MKGLLRKEFTAIKWFYLLATVLGLFAVSTSFIHKETNTVTMWIYFTAVIPVAPALLQSKDRENGWKSFEAVLPLSKSKIVSSKFIVALAGVLQSVVVIAASMIISKYFFALDDVFKVSEIYYAIISLSSAVIAAGFTILAGYLFGSLGEFIAMFFIGLSNGVATFTEFEYDILVFVLLVAIISAVVLFAVCWLLSVWVYRRKGIK